MKFCWIEPLEGRQLLSTYYLSPGGDDSHAGTSPATAWKTIAKINAMNFGAGDAILFQGGATFITNATIAFDAADGGTPANPLTINSYDPATGLPLGDDAPASSRAVISSGTKDALYAYRSGGFEIRNLKFVGAGQSTNTGQGIFFYSDGGGKKDHVYIDNVETSGFGGFGLLIGGISGGGFNDVRITDVISHDNLKGGIATYGDNFSPAAKNYAHSNVYVGHSLAYENDGDPNATGNTGNGIVLGSVNNATIERSVAHDNGIANKPNEGPVGIWVYDTNNAVIQYNESYHNRTASSADGDGFDFDQNTTNSVMQFNYSHDNDGAGYLIYAATGRTTHDNVVRYNISQNDGRKNSYSGIYAGLDVTNLDIYNNTIFTGPRGTNGVYGGVQLTAGVSNIRVRNNIIVTSGGLPAVIAASNLSGIVFQNNDYFSSGAAAQFRWGNQTYGSLAAWRTATGQERINGIDSGFIVDPKLVNAGGGGTLDDSDLLSTLAAYQLQSNSPMIDAGLNLSTMFGINPGTSDFYGNTLPQGSAYDVGAHEFPISGSIAGTVFNDVNSNSTLDSGESGIANWTVYLDTNNNGSLDADETFTTTDAAGDYIFTGLTSATYHVKQVFQSGYRKTLPNAGVQGYDVAINGDAITGKNFGQTTNIYLAGHVFNDANANGTQDAGEDAMADVTINIISNETIIATRVTDANGFWQVRGLSAGTGEVVAVLPSGYVVIAPAVGKYAGSASSGQQMGSLNFALLKTSRLPQAFHHYDASMLEATYVRLDFFAEASA